MTEAETTEVPAKTIDDPIMAKLVMIVGEARASNSELERVVYSGDPSSLPQFHYRWKGKYLCDYIVRVKTSDEIEAVLRVAKENGLTITPRGGASSCMCSSSPTRGGISIDIKPMNRVLEINEDEMYVRVEAGITFDRLDRELVKFGYTLGIYPSSAKSAVLGGWLSCGGRAGVGTPLYGALRENTLEIIVVTAEGKTMTVDDDRISIFFGSFGILGIITEMKLKIRKIEDSLKTYSYSFVRLEHICNAMAQISKLEKQPLFLKMAEKELQEYSNPLPKGNYVLTITYPDKSETYPEEEIRSIMAENGGVRFDEEYSSKEWESRLDCEFNPKEHTDTLMLQELWIPVDAAYEILKKYENYKKTHKVPALWYGMLGDQAWIRLELMAMLSAEQYLKFISSKGVLHKMMKMAIKLGGGPYTIGLQNSIYMKKAYPKKLASMKKLKAEWDPNNLMNPDRVVSCLTSYRRINILFVMAASIRRLSKFLDRSELYPKKK